MLLSGQFPTTYTTLSQDTIIIVSKKKLSPQPQYTTGLESSVILRLLIGQRPQIIPKQVVESYDSSSPIIYYIEMFYLNSTLNFGIPPVLVFQLEVYFKVDRLLTGLTAQQKRTTARWYSNKTSLPVYNR